LPSRCAWILISPLVPARPPPSILWDFSFLLPIIGYSIFSVPKAVRALRKRDLSNRHFFTDFPELDACRSGTVPEECPDPPASFFFLGTEIVRSFDFLSHHGDLAWIVWDSPFPDPHFDRRWSLSPFPVQQEAVSSVFSSGIRWSRPRIAPRRFLCLWARW